MMRKESYAYNTFASIRISEIQRKTDVSQWQHAPSDENIADLLTKGTSPDQIAAGSRWQDGPPWLIKDRSEWPVKEVNLRDEDKQQVRSLFPKVD